jgi:hypothetical protein
MRDSLKNVRTREEGLDDMKRRRKVLFGKAEAAEKKLAKMSPENKNLQGQTELLNSLRDSIRGIDGEIMREEAALGDLKRREGRSIGGALFGGIEEAGGKSVVSNSNFLVDPSFPCVPAFRYFNIKFLRLASPR